MEGLPCGIVAFGDDLQLTEVNEAAAEMLGYHAVELVGQPLVTLFSNAGRIFLHTHLRPLLALNGRLDEIYMTLRTRDGASLPVLLNGTRPPGAKASVFVFLGMRRRQFFEQELIAAKRVAEEAALAEKAAREETKIMQAQLAARERLASVGTLAAGVAHEINNPLAAVMGHLEVLDEELGDAADVDRAGARALVGRALEGAGRIRRIVQTMRVLSQTDVAPQVPVDLARTVADAARLCASQVAHRTRVEIDVRGAPRVRGDAGRIGQVLVSLLVNAAQAFSERSPENVVRVVVRASDDGAGVLEVADNGPGIPGHLHAQIFDPFFTTKEVGAGMGLGLSICHRLVDEMGGTIDVDSAPGRGATFRVTWPAARAAERAQ